MRESRALVTSCNGVFAPGAEALLRSAARFMPDIVRYCFVPPEEVDERRVKLGSLARVEPFPRRIGEIPAENMANVGRLFVILPDVDVAAYVDADALICAPCEMLWKVAPGRVNAVEDSAICVADNMLGANRLTFIQRHSQVALRKGVNSGGLCYEEEGLA